MYASECIAHQKAEIKFETVNGYPALQIESDFGLVNFTMSHAQLEDLLEKGEWWLLKKDDPAAKLDEILEGLNSDCQ